MIVLSKKRSMGIDRQQCRRKIGSDGLRRGTLPVQLAVRENTGVETAVGGDPIKMGIYNGGGKKTNMGVKKGLIPSQFESVIGKKISKLKGARISRGADGVLTKVTKKRLRGE